MNADDQRLIATWAPERVVERMQLRKINNPSSSKTISSNEKGLVWSLAEAVYEQLKEPLILMLLGSAGISLLLGNTADALSIGVALLIVCMVAAVQEYRSEQALGKLVNLVPHTANLLTFQNTVEVVQAENLEVADTVLVAAGDRIPADLRLIESVELSVDESMLTGETFPVTKQHGAVVEGQGVDPSTNICFCGTLVTAGRAKGVCIAVGSDTAIGRIAESLESTTSRKSPLQLQLDDLSQLLAKNCMIAIGLIALVGWLMRRPVLETLQVAVSLAVAAIPEGLPICVTVTLALGVLKMARQKAVCKKLSIVESLGCTTAVCSDKTGTMTENKSRLPPGKPFFRISNASLIFLQ